jgi:hypothetical protein
MPVAYHTPPVHSCGQPAAPQAPLIDALPGAPAQPIMGPAPLGTQRRTGLRGLLIALVGVSLVGVLAVTWGAYGAVRGGGGGADSPAAAVRAMAHAVTKKDTAAAAAMLTPGETQGLAPAVSHAEKQVSDFQLGGSPKLYNGIDLTITDLDLATETLDANTAVVTIQRGRLHLVIEPGSMTERTRVMLDGAGRITRDIDLSKRWISGQGGERRQISVVVVKRSGRWFISPTYTLGEYLRVATGTQRGDMSPKDAGRKFASAQEAGKAFVQAMASIDVPTLAATMTISESSGWLAYRRTVESMIDDSALGRRPTVSVSQVDFTEDKTKDGRTLLTVKTLSGSIDTGSGQTRFDFDGRCLDLRQRYGSTTTSCLGGQASSRQSTPLSALKQIQLVADSDAGHWRISPLATVIANFDALVTSLTENGVLGWLGYPQLATPSETIEPGKSGMAHFNDANYAVVSLRGLREGSAFTVRIADSDERTWVEVYTKGEDTLSADWDPDADQYVYRADRPGPYTAVVRWSGSNPPTGVTVEVAYV